MPVLTAAPSSCGLCNGAGPFCCRSLYCARVPVPSPVSVLIPTAAHGDALPLTASMWLLIHAAVDVIG